MRGPSPPVPPFALIPGGRGQEVGIGEHGRPAQSHFLSISVGHFINGRHTCHSLAFCQAAEHDLS